MKRISMRALAAVVGAMLFFLGLFNAAMASAINEYVGQTYSKASQQISSSGGTAVVATVVGEQVARGDCMVIGSKKSSFLDSSGKSKASVLLDLDCNQTLAAPGKPGNSAVTPQGAKLKAIQEQATQLDTDLATAKANGTTPYCGQSADNFATCTNFCKQNDGACSSDLLSYLASLG